LQSEVLASLPALIKTSNEKNLNYKPLFANLQQNFIVSSKIKAGENGRRGGGAVGKPAEPKK